MPTHSKTGFIEVAPDMWALIMSVIPPEGGGPNAGVIVAGDQVLVIDSLISPGTGRQLAEHMGQVTERSVSYLVNTHHHGDHVFGNQAFSPPGTIIAHETVREALISQGQAMLKSYAERFPQLAPDIKETTVIPPQITFRDRMSMHFDGRTIELIHPGVAHTHGDTMVYLPKEKILFAGDLLFNHIFPPIFGSSAGWIATLERVEAMDIETIVPGHGFIATKKDLGEFRKCLTDLRNQVKDCLTRGLSPEQATKEIQFPCLQWPRAERLGPDVEMIYEELKKEGL